MYKNNIEIQTVELPEFILNWYFDVYPDSVLKMLEENIDNENDVNSIIIQLYYDNNEV